MTPWPGRRYRVLSRTGNDDVPGEVPWQPAENVPAIRQPRVTMIKGLSQPARTGKIKIGAKAAMGEVAQWHRVSSAEETRPFPHHHPCSAARTATVRDVEIHKLFGDKPVEIRSGYSTTTRASIFPRALRLLYRPQPVVCRRRRIGDADRPSGAGKISGQLHLRAPDTPSQGSRDKRKMNGVPSSSTARWVGGVWKFRTVLQHDHRHHVVLAFLKSVTGGVLANIPLMPTVRPKQATDPEGDRHHLRGRAGVRGNIEELQANRATALTAPRHIYRSRISRMKPAASWPHLWTHCCPATTGTILSKSST